MNLDEFVSTCGFESPEDLAAALKADKAAVADLTAKLAAEKKRADDLETAQKATAVKGAMLRAEVAGRIPKESEKLTEPEKQARAFALKLAETDATLFEQWLASAPPVKPAPTGRLPLGETATDGVEGETPEAELAKVQAYAKEHKLSLGAAYEAMGIKRAAN